MIFPILAVNLALVRDLTTQELRTCGQQFAPADPRGAGRHGRRPGGPPACPGRPQSRAQARLAGVRRKRQDVVTIPGLTGEGGGCFVESPLAMVGVGGVSGLLFSGTNVSVQLIAYLRSCDLPTACSSASSRWCFLESQRWRPRGRRWRASVCIRTWRSSRRRWLRRYPRSVVGSS